MAAAKSIVPGRRVAAWLVDRMIRRDLKRTFRRIVWIGAEPWKEGALDPARPLVLYTNHHSFHDGYFLWWLTHQTLDRPPILWMNDWEQIPLFGPIGALPFPTDDAAQRLATIRETARRLAAGPEHVFVYFPEGELRAPDTGLGEFDPTAFTRLARLFPADTQWWPVGMRVTWWGEDRPTVLLTGGTPHEPDGRERDRLQALLTELQAMRPGMGRTLLDGAASAHERWNLAALAPLFRRWT